MSCRYHCACESERVFDIFREIAILSGDEVREIMFRLQLWWKVEVRLRCCKRSGRGLQWRYGGAGKSEGEIGASNYTPTNGTLYKLRPAWGLLKSYIHTQHLILKFASRFCPSSHSQSRVELIYGSSPTSPAISAHFSVVLRNFSFAPLSAMCLSFS